MKNPTYTVNCRKGLNRLTCPLVLQQGMHCVECGYAFYIKREPAPVSEDATEDAIKDTTEQSKNE
jgi:hypothetical protein